jgi:hypothetical protein
MDNLETNLEVYAFNKMQPVYGHFRKVFDVEASIRKTAEHFGVSIEYTKGVLGVGFPLFPIG